MAEVAVTFIVVPPDDAEPFVVPVGIVPAPNILKEVTFAKPEDIFTVTVLAHVPEPVGRLIVTSPIFVEASLMQYPTSVVVKDAAVPIFPFHEQAA